MCLCCGCQRIGRFHADKPNVDRIVHRFPRHGPRGGQRVGGPFEVQIGMISQRLLSHSSLAVSTAQAVLFVRSLTLLGLFL